MTAPRRQTLQLPDSPRHHEWEWRSARIFEILLPAIMLATALGVFGNGLLAGARAGEPGSALWIEFDRVVRFGAPVRLVVHAQRSREDGIELTLERATLERFAVQRVTPEPASTALARDGLTYRFDANADQPAPVIFELQPISRWRQSGQIRSPDAAVEFVQFILP